MESVSQPLIYGVLMALLLGVMPVSAEIYQSKDSDGNPVYTDHPQPGAERVSVPETNVADEPPPATAPAQAQDAGGGNVVVIPDSRSEALQQELESERRHSVRDADIRREVSDADVRRSVSDADERRSVSDADERRSVSDAEPRKEVRDAEPRD